MQAVAWEYVASAIVGGFIGGGSLATVGYLALRGKLIDDLSAHFASKADLNGLGDRVTAFSSVTMQTRERADENADAIIRLQEAGNAHAQALSRTLTRIDQRLDEFDSRQRADRGMIDKTATLLDQLEKRMDRHQHGGKD